MVKKTYVPDRRDIVWINLNPTLGREQANHRPALVLSPRSYNKKTGLVVVCPLTSKVKGYPFEVLLTDVAEPSAILADQIRTLDWQERGIKFWRKVPLDILEETQAKLATLIM
jgi:mRNA interferase MazF